MNPRILVTRQDVTEEVLETVWDIIVGWYLEDPIDWEDVLDRADNDKWQFGTQWDDPAITYVQREMRRRKREI